MHSPDPSVKYAEGLGPAISYAVLFLRPSHSVYVYAAVVNLASAGLAVESYALAVPQLHALQPTPG